MQGIAQGQVAAEMNNSIKFLGLTAMSPPFLRVPVFHSLSQDAVNQRLGLQAGIPSNDHIPISKVHKQGDVQVFYGRTSCCLSKLLLYSVLQLCCVDAGHSLHHLCAAEEAKKWCCPDLHADHKVLLHTAENGHIPLSHLQSET